MGLGLMSKPIVGAKPWWGVGAKHPEAKGLTFFSFAIYISEA